MSEFSRRLPDSHVTRFDPLSCKAIRLTIDPDNVLARNDDEVDLRVDIEYRLVKMGFAVASDTLPKTAIGILAAAHPIRGNMPRGRRAKQVLDLSDGKSLRIISQR